MSVEACRRNIKFNGSVASSKVESHLEDARVYMLTHLKEFDVVCSICVLLWLRYLERNYNRKWLFHLFLCYLFTFQIQLSGRCLFSGIILETF